MNPTTGPVCALVLLCCGTPTQVEALHTAAAVPLATALGLRLGAALPLDPDPLGHGALGALEAGTLVPLLRDPGQGLAGGGHWAETLGAWRQQCVLLVSTDQLDSGVAAATTALLQQWQVPLLGLVQGPGPWDGEARRADRLPWLGGLGLPELALAATLRWRQLEAQRS